MNTAINIQLISALVTAARRVGGIHNLEMPADKTTWRDCVESGGLWYNNATTHSSGFIPINRQWKHREK